MRISDWSSDVCSSDLLDRQGRDGLAVQFGVEQIGLRTKLDARHIAQSYGGSIRISAEDDVPELLGRGEAALGKDCRIQFRLAGDRKVTNLPARTRSEEPTSELQSLMRTSFDVLC